ncbi:ATP-binding cassette domain-containing protein [Roseomonas sp. GC11]|uniref:ABC transporter ATP-binding protein n=1 Tax=Roseomonas sp. GC11 TaxID=2950546 RepID=UPI00210D958C|nr:ATP-binding cassette domain-containing protein [Roseomonas sp. GC11]MCQ4161587.1 ATP-binding cassette domain-containing protein [Roseomonas sp. GC11]
MSLIVEGLSIHGPEGCIVRDVGFTARPGEPMVLLGETGSGKSLVAQAVMGVLPAGLRAEGRILLDGQDLLALSARERRGLWGRRIAMLPQEPWSALDPTMRAFGQVEEVHRLVRGRPAAEAAGAARADLARLGLATAARRYPFELSGGMNQRVALAATHAAGAPVLIADEPTKGLDAAMRDTAAALLLGEAREGRILLVITHDVVLAGYLGGEAVVMLEGQAVESGPLRQLLAAPRHEYTRRLVAADPARWASWPARPVPGGRALVEGRGLHKRLGGRELFGGLTLEVAAGEVLAVSGPSGCGKTTLGNMLLGLARPDAGEVRRRPDLGPLSFQKLYQDPMAAFPPTGTLGQALTELLRRHAIPRAPAEALMRRLRLTEVLLGRRADQVSGGQLQRFGLLRALLLKPALLFADEATSRLDPVTQQEVMDLLREVVAEQGTALLVVTHEEALAAKVAGRVVHLAPQVVGLSPDGVPEAALAL